MLFYLCFGINLRYFLFFALFISCLFSTSLVMAESISDKKKELTALQKKIKAIGKKVGDLNVEKNTLIAELKKIDIQYGNNRTQLRILVNDVKRLNNVLEKNQKQIGIKKVEIKDQKIALENQVKLAYGMGRHEKLKLILNQENPSVSERMMIYYDYLNKERLDRIAAIKQGLHVLKALEIEKIKETKVLKVKVEQIKKDRSVLARTKVERKKVLAKINKRFSVKTAELSQFKKDEKKLKNLIKSLQQTIDNFPFDAGSSKEFSLLKGKLPWPVQGKIIKKFGAQRSDTESRWDGVLLNAKEGTVIRAVAKGRVIYSDWLRGYGLLTIIDHGKGYMTLYAFNQSLYKKTGDLVDLGAIVATVGQSGVRAESGLYFGIRKKGMPLDPVKWCSKMRHR